MKCKDCPANGNFNGCPCYFGNEEKDCKLTKKQVIKMIDEYEEENEAFYRSYGC